MGMRSRWLAMVGTGAAVAAGAILGCVPAGEVPPGDAASGDCPRGSVNGFIVDPVQADVGRCYTGGYKIYPETNWFSTAQICLKCVDPSCVVEGHKYDPAGLPPQDRMTGRVVLSQGQQICVDRAAPQLGTTSYIFPIQGYIAVTSVKSSGGGGSNDLGLR